MLSGNRRMADLGVRKLVLHKETIEREGGGTSRDNSGHGLQADHHRQQDLAAAHGKQCVENILS